MNITPKRTLSVLQLIRVHEEWGLIQLFVEVSFDYGKGHNNRMLSRLCFQLMVTPYQLLESFTRLLDISDGCENVIPLSLWKILTRREHSDTKSRLGLGALSTFASKNFFSIPPTRSNCVSNLGSLRSGILEPPNRRLYGQEDLGTGIPLLPGAFGEGSGFLSPRE